MQVIVHNITDPNKEAVLKAAALYYGKRLLPIMCKKITINLYYDHHNLCRDFEAETEWTDSNIFPKVFSIKFNKNIKNFRKIVQTLAHEMVHVKQFAKGEIYDHKYRRTFKWGKETYNVDTCDYWDLPWEIEAFGREIGLFARFKEFFDLTTKNLEKDFDIAANKVSKKYKLLLAYNPQTNKIKKTRKGEDNADVDGNDVETSA